MLRNRHRKSTKLSDQPGLDHQRDFAPGFLHLESFGELEIVRCARRTATAMLVDHPALLCARAKQADMSILEVTGQGATGWHGIQFEQENAIWPEVECLQSSGRKILSTMPEQTGRFANRRELNGVWLPSNRIVRG